MIFAGEELIPRVTADPSGGWFFNWVIPIAGSIFIVLAIADVARRRRLTWGFLFLFNSIAVYWMETIGDWGQMLFYSPTFAQHHLLGRSRPARAVAQPVGVIMHGVEHAQIDGRAGHPGQLRLGFPGRGHCHRAGL